MPGSSSRRTVTRVLLPVVAAAAVVISLVRRASVVGVPGADADGRAASPVLVIRSAPSSERPSADEDSAAALVLATMAQPQLAALAIALDELGGRLRLRADPFVE